MEKLPPPPIRRSVHRRFPYKNTQGALGSDQQIHAHPGKNQRREFETLLANDDKTIDRHLLARRLADAYVKQFFDMRLFHADPHPGNILIRPPAQIGLIDFGQAGTISDEVAGQLVLLIVAMVYRETEVVVEILADQGAVPGDTDTKALSRSLRQLLDKYYGLPLKRLDLVTIFSEIADVIRMYNVTLPREMVIVLKTLTTVAGVALKLDPELDLLGIMSPRLKGLIAKRFSSRRIAKTLAVSTWHIASILKKRARATPRLYAKSRHR